MSGYGASRFDAVNAFGSNYTTPGWQRAQARKARGDVGGFDENGQRRYVPDGVFDQDDDSESYSDNLSPGGRGRAEGAGEGDGRKRSAPSPGSPDQAGGRHPLPKGRG